MASDSKDRSNESIRDRFVGRTEALDTFYMRRAYRHMKNGVYFFGDGGVGKTWLLRKIQLDNQDDPYQIVVGIIDFFDTRNQNIRGLQATLKDHLQSPGLFRAYDQVLEQLNEARVGGKDLHPSAIASLEARANQQFIECCIQAAVGREIILLFDTFERVQQRYVGRWLREAFLSKVTGPMVAIAGRPVPVTADMPDNIVPHELKGLGLLETGEHVRRSGRRVAEADLEKIWKHTEGAPLLIDLILDLSDSQRQEFLSSLSNLRDDARVQSSPTLKRGLVGQFAEPTDVNKVIWAMAYLRRRFDVGMLRFVVERGGWFKPDDYDAIFERLSRSPYVKDYPRQQSHLLHDEIQQMIGAYILQEVADPWSEMRDPLYDLVVNHWYPAAIADAAPDLEHQLRAEQLGYLLDNDPPAGLLAYQAYCREIEETFDYDFEELLWGEVREHLDDFDEHGYHVSHNRGQWLHRHSLFQKGEEHYRQMLDRFEGRQIDTRQSLGFMLMRQGKISEAKEVFEESLQQIKDDEHQFIAQIERNLGQSERWSGDWEKALEHYARSFRAATLARDREMMVSVYVNRGFLYSHQGLYADAVRQCERAISELASLPTNQENIQREIYAKMNLGIAYRHEGDYGRAEWAYEESLALAEENNNQEAICDILQQLGINDHLKGRQLRRDHGDLSDACDHQQRAWDHLTQALESARKTGWRRAAADGLHRLAKVYREIDRLETAAQESRSRGLETKLDRLQKKAQGYSVPFEIEYEREMLMPGAFSSFNWLQKAARMFEISALLAEEANDFHRVLDGLTEFSLLLLELGQLDQVGLVIRRIERTKGYDYQEELFSEMNQITVGDWHFEQQEYEIALAKYKVSYAKLAKLSGYAIYLLTDRLRGLRHRLESLPMEMTLAWCDALEEEWLSRSVSTVRPDMLNLLEDARVQVLGTEKKLG